MPMRQVNVDVDVDVDCRWTKANEDEARAKDEGPKDEGHVALAAS